MLEFVKIGKIKKPLGTQGWLKARIEYLYLSHLEHVHAAFVLIDGNHVPFLIQGIEQDRDVLIKFKNIDSPEQVSDVVNTNIYLATEQLGELGMPIEQTSSEWEGFILKVNNDDLEFNISRIEQFPQQKMLIIEAGQDEVMIPLVEDWIVEIDEESRTIVMSLPEGLIQI